MKVHVFNRNHACELKPMPDTVVISITCPNDPAPLDWGWGNILRLEFHDITFEDYDPTEKGFPIQKEKLVLFSDTQALQVVEFVEKFADKSFMVHCDAGRSRSVAVGLFIASWQEKELILHEIDSIFSRNSHVEALLRRVLNRRAYGDSIQYKGE